jgi:outer membrane murein-binding lipoprotein Lpp
MIAWPGVAFARKRVRWGEVVAIARCDFAIWRPVPDNSRQPSIRATQVIMHSMASPGTSPQELIRYWSQPGTPLESHFIVGRDGRAWQLVDTGRSADANYRANRRPDGTGAISIETEDNVGHPDTLPWTQAQIDTLVRLALWAARVHGVPRRRCPSPSAPGIGYHAVALSTLVPTGAGLRAIAELGVGDQVFDELGMPCRVTGVYDVWPERCHRLRFSDGAEVVASGDHLWVTWTKNQRHYYFRRGGERHHHRGPKPIGFPDDWAAMRPPRTTDELVATLTAADGYSNHAIPLARPLRYPDSALPIDPYILGVWLGDGNAQAATINTSLAAAGTDAAFISGQLAEAGYRLGAWGVKRDSHSAWFGVLRLTAQLRALGVLGDKHIPPAYLYAAPAQRLALLQGLMDTDGTTGKAGRVMFSTADKAMAESVLWLACSLGQKPVIHQVPYPAGRGGRGTEYRLWWTATAPVFRMPRKLAKLNLTSTSELHARMLVRAEPAPLQPMRCLAVDSPRSMYLITPWCIPTHNTMFGSPSAWTPVSKTCPGTIRIRQFNQTVLPAIVAGTAGGGLSVADANSLERHLDVIQEKIERTFNQVNIKTGDLANRVEKLEGKVERTFNQVNATTNALSEQHDDLAAQVAQLQRDMELVKDALNIP